jgi:Ser/Thr protein kinase RdoA (MazF antagonist)
VSQQDDYHNLTPDKMMDAIESLGYQCDARNLALNSYENRVFRVGLEDDIPIIAKFYRPNRWVDAQILEEHRYTQELVDAEIPVVAPLQRGNKTIFYHDGFRFSLYPLTAGHAPELDNHSHLQWLGRSIGRMHAVGKLSAYQHRPVFDIESFVTAPMSLILEQQFIPMALESVYKSIQQQITPRLSQILSRSHFQPIRLHGDCHPGNILWTDKLPHFVDFDDSRTGPAIQDLWMLLSGDRQDQLLQLNHILKGYTQFCQFNLNELQLIEALRSMRIIHYAGWLAKRWNDPAFPMTFPWFDTAQFWDEHILQLKEQLAALDEEPLEWINEPE